MFSSLGLFQNIACPDKNTCSRPHCIFSHRTDLPPPPELYVPVEESKVTASFPRPSIPAKRSVAHSPHYTAGKYNGSPLEEPPRKQQKVDSVQKKSTVSSTSYTSVCAIILPYSVCLLLYKFRREFHSSRSTQLNLRWPSLLDR